MQLSKRSAKISSAILSSAIVLSLTACGGSSSTTTKVNPVLPTNTANTLESVFPVHTSVFGVAIRATKETNSVKVLHAANIMAQYLDNDEDGVPDNQAVVDAMVARKATLLMAPTDADIERAMASFEPSGEFQDLYGSEVHVSSSSGEFDASLEEVLHLITHVGYSHVYPEVFGEKIDSAIADAMDIARGGRFEQIPARYPDTAWYTYDDTTCNYSCMVTEYTYWALTSILGAQQSRLEQIGHEWKLNTAEKVRLQDPTVHGILTNPEYALATKLPTGQYSYQSFTLSGTTDQGGVPPTTSGKSGVIGASSKASCEEAGDVEANACFIVDNNKAEMNGVIGGNIEAKVKQLIDEYPDVKTIVLDQVPGSEDDESNLAAALMVYKAKLNTEVLSTSSIASGGVDFFLAGNKRVIAQGAEIGVHSWATEDDNGNVIQGADVPKDDPVHQSYIKFYQDINHPNASEFYFYTLNAATADDIHIMSSAEIEQWQMARE